MTRVFVTGGSGYLGGHLLKALIAQGYEVVAMARSDRAAERVAALGAKPALGGLDQVAGLDGCAVVIHAASRFMQPGDYATYARDNIEGTRTLLQGARAAGVLRFVYVGAGLPDQHKEIDAKLRELEAAGHPVIRLAMNDAYDVGELFYTWEVATAAAGSILQIDAFDQPNVQESKDNTKALLKQFASTGKFDEPAAAVSDEVMDISFLAGSEGIHAHDTAAALAGVSDKALRATTWRSAHTSRVTRSTPLCSKRCASKFATRASARPPSDLARVSYTRPDKNTKAVPIPASLCRSPPTHPTTCRFPAWA